jgi:hypothetical protein
MSVFDPNMKAITFDEFSQLTEEQLANNIVVHTMRLKKQMYHVWSKYDEQGTMIQRCMIRSDLWEAQCRQ